MVLPGSQMSAFFENADQMSIPHVTVIQLQAEGVTSILDLLDFEKDSLDELVDNLHDLGGKSLTQAQLQELVQQYQHHLLCFE